MAEVNDIYFGVTDHHIIIPLKVVKVTEVELGNDDTSFQVETEIACEVTSYMECHHRICFEIMWLGDDGLPDKGNVFVDEKDAVAYALKKAGEEKRKHQRDIDGIQRQISKLRTYNV